MSLDVASTGMNDLDYNDLSRDLVTHSFVCSL